MSKKRFTEEYKKEAIKLVKEGGLSVNRAAKDLGIGDSTLGKWLRVAAENSPEPLTLNEKEELRELRKEVNQLRMERDILKKASAYFASRIA